MAQFQSCIFIMADGARADVFQELLNRGDLPHISKYIVDKGGYTNAVSVFPSTTGPAYTPFILGRFPGRCNLPGIRWFDRTLYSKKLLSLFRSRSYVGIEGFLMNRDIAEDAPTLFEIFPESSSILNELSRGAGFRGDKTRFRRIYYKLKSHFTDRSDEVDMAARDILLYSLEESPQFNYTVFLGIDTYSHLHHPFHSKVIESYLRLDETIGLVGRFLRDRGRLDETLLIIASDHGLTQTHSHFDSLQFMNQLGFKTFYYPNIFRFYRDADAANMVSGNAMTHIYVKSPGGWGRRCYFEELSRITDRLIERPEVDIVAGLDEKGQVRAISKRGESMIWLTGENEIRYEVVNGDPFGYERFPGRMSVEDVLKKSIHTNYPDAPLQLIQLLECARSGDLVVSASHGFDFRATHENPEHCSSHGALLREHMLVPFCINTKIKKEFVRTVDLYPTIISLLGHSAPKGIDGVNLTV